MDSSAGDGDRRGELEGEGVNVLRVEAGEGVNLCTSSSSSFIGSVSWSESGSKSVSGVGGLVAGVETFGGGGVGDFLGGGGVGVFRGGGGVGVFLGGGVGVLVKGVNSPGGEGFLGGGGVGDLEEEVENGVSCLEMGIGANRG